jgi:methyl-accepting chemotaxis protein
MKLKIKTKISGGLFCIFLLLVIMASYSFFVIRYTEILSDELDVLTDFNDTVNTIIDEHNAWRYRTAAAFLYGEETMDTPDYAYRTYETWQHNGVNDIVDSPRIRELFATIDESYGQMYTEAETTMHLMEAGMMDEAYVHMRDVVRPLYLDYMERLIALSTYIEELREVKRYEYSRYKRNSNWVFLALTLISAGLYFLLSTLITRSILIPIKRLVTLASDVAAGHANINKDTSHLADDEIGQLTHDMYILTDTVQSVIEELNTLNYEVNTLGNMKYRTDPTKYSGAFREVCENMNRFADEYVTHMDTLLEAITELRDGNFSYEMKEMPGDKAILKQQVSKVRDDLMDIHNEITELASHVTVGKLDIRLEMTKYKGGWAELVERLNQLVTAVSDPFATIMKLMIDMQKGDFSHVADTNYGHEGVFRQITESLNTTVSTISSYITEIENVTAELADGDLQGKIEREYVGSFDLIKRSINKIL